MIHINFTKLTPTAIPFKYSYDNDACMDIFTDTEMCIPANKTIIVPTNISIELPKNYEGRVRGRSGFSSKGLLVHQGVIDEGYRGNIGVIITNLNKTPYTIKYQDRIAQFSIHPIYKIHLIEESLLSDTERGDNGFGSTGV